MKEPVLPKRPQIPILPPKVVKYIYVDYQFSFEETKRGMVDLGLEQLNGKLRDKGVNIVLTASDLTFDATRDEDYDLLVHVKYSYELAGEEFRQFNKDYIDQVNQYEKACLEYEEKLKSYEEAVQDYQKAMYEYTQYKGRETRKKLYKKLKQEFEAS